MRRDPDEIVYIDNGRGVMEPEAKVKADQRKRAEFWDWAWDKAGPWLMPAGALILMLNYWMEQWLRH